MSARNPTRAKLIGQPLTEREIQVARMCAQDLADKQIADRLGLAEKTVEQHVHALRFKLGVRSKIGVALWASKQEQG